MFDAILGMTTEIITQKSAKQKATRLLDWLVAFLPTAIPPSPEEAILDDSGDVNALLWHRSELENGCKNRRRL
jgi:hypothetical protein